jgi:hypothetical protein
MKLFAEKEDMMFMNLCCEYITTNWATVKPTKLKKLFREALKMVSKSEISDYRKERILSMLRNRYLTQDQKIADDVKKIPKIIEELQRTMNTMEEDAQEKLKMKLHETFKTKEQIESYKEIEAILQEPPLKKQRCDERCDDGNDNVLDVSTCSLFDFL